MKILLLGATGLAGSYIKNLLEDRKLNYKAIGSTDLNLINRSDTVDYIGDLKPTCIINAAAKVGGIVANDEYPVEFLSENLQIQDNVFHAAHKIKVEKLVFIGSSCIYPRLSPQPIKEEFLLSGKLEKTNSAYAIAKIAGIELIKAYRKQYGYKWISLMPSNLYGRNDNYNLETAHVLPALIHRFVAAAESKLYKLRLWGSGQPKREFLHASDFARALMICLEKYDGDEHINVGSGTDISIANLATIIAELSGFSGEIEWDRSRPDGTPRKLLDNTKITSLGWQPSIDLVNGIQDTIDFFKTNYESVRR